MKKLICLAIILPLFAGLYAQTKDSALIEYKGVYRFPDGSVVTSVEITVDNGSLVASSTMGSATLEKITKDTFNLTVYNGTVYFTRNTDGKVDGIKILVQDIVLEGKKEGGNIAFIRRRSPEFVKQSFYKPVIGSN